MKEAFKEHRFTKETAAKIAIANKIIAQYQAQGLRLSVRQLYYQFVSKDLVPNSEKSYKSLINAITRAREAGLVDWDAIEDRNRRALQVSGSETVTGALQGIERRIVRDLWKDQEYYPEVWIEKDALTGTIERVCNRFRVTYMACKGYLSASAVYLAGKRFEDARHEGKTPVIIHLGDHDPSGIHMTEDNQERSELFSWGDVEIHRIALNMNQIQQYNPPPNPAKLTDTRATTYINQYGMSSWELDALDPSVISDLVQDELESLITDQSAFDEEQTIEEGYRDELRKLRNNWEAVAMYLEGLED